MRGSIAISQMAYDDCMSRVTSRPLPPLLKPSLRRGAWLLAMLLWLAPPLQAQTYKVDAATSQSLTAYLRQHRLPLAGAQVLTNGSGQRRVVLYGFCATEFGRNDASHKAMTFLKSNDIPIDNRIAVRPEIASMKTAGDTVRPAASNPQSLDQVLDEIDRYGVSFAPQQSLQP
jgi:hypothetical protein